MHLPSLQRAGPVTASPTTPSAQPQGLYPDHVRDMGFVSGALFDRRRLHPLTIIDLFTRECPGDPYRFFPAGYTDVQCHGGVVQRQAAPGVPERERVHVPGGCAVQNRGLAHTL